MSSALVNRSLSTLKTELEFLRDSNVITENFYSQIISKLPDRYKEGASPIDFPPSNTSNVSLSTKEEKTEFTPPSRPPTQPLEEYVEVIYNYKPQESGDLELFTGDKVKVVEYVSADWWKGESRGQTGMFPSNYVKPLSLSAPPSRPPPGFQQYNTQQQNQQNQQNNQQQQQYVTPQPQQPFQPQYQQYQQYPANNSPFPPQNVVPYQQYASPQPQQQSQVIQGQEQPHKHGSLHKFGSKLGNAAIFGAGATIGSDIVNSIF